MTPADYCDAMARWWRDASAGDMPRTLASAERAAIDAINDAVMADPSLADKPRGDAWDRAAARLRAHNLHAAADAAEET